ncbi:hypothetical protein CAC42_1400 [Sphaceloma murrayae]|uniref:Nucleolar protein 16 n=1 Tax=Sphaceloma murrayae TaxID=2082308 RepID=A0A2K1QG98_9PEZI|nr:hypothetical protein CAC42_1400 [Sphaceloma murrayae]
MGRERQKFKNRSSVSKVKHKPKSKKKLLHNPIIAANWNQKETLSQNYKRLGLTSRLNHTAGGTEKLISSLPNEDEEDDDDDENEKPSKTSKTRDMLNINAKLPTHLDVSEVRVVRDPETGAIISVLDEDMKKANPLRDPLNDLSDSEGEGWEGFVNEHGLIDGAKQKQDGTTEVVRRLEEEAARPVAKRERWQSEREKEWIESLVNKYGEDYAKMSRDIKLNPMQQSEGDIKKRIRKWNKSKGGIAA